MTEKFSNLYFIAYFFSLEIFMKKKNNPNDLDYREIRSPVKDNSIFNRSSIKIEVIFYQA